MRLQELKSQRAAKIAELRTINEKAMHERRDLDENERNRFGVLDAEVRNLNEQIERAERLAAYERIEASAEPVTPRAGDSMAALERRFSIGRAIHDFSEGGRLTGAEAEYSAENRSGRPGAFAAPTSVFLGERRAVTTATDGGGNLVETMLGPEIDRLRPLLAVERMGATVLPGLTDSLDLPRLDASGTAAFVAEHTDATGGDPTWDKISLSPHTVGSRYEISRRMLIQAAQVDTILRNDIGWLLAQAIDAAAISGGGSNQPTGIIANTDVPVLGLGANGLAMTIDNVADMIGMLGDANADISSSTAFLTNSKVRRAALKLKDSQNRPYTDQQIWKGEPVTYSNQVPNNLTKGSGTNLSAILYGAWQNLIVAYWSQVDILFNPFADSIASKGGAFLHAFIDCDVGLRHPEAFAVCKDVVA